MELYGGEFVTNASKGTFDITITQESDCSMDGGYSFMDVSNTFKLDKDEAITLIEELTAFVDDTSDLRCGGYGRVGWHCAENRQSPWATCHGCEDCKA